MGKIDFTGQTALITGGGQGLGLAYAELLASRGAKVLVNDIGLDRDGVPLASRTAEKIRESGGAAAADQSDVSTPEGVERSVKAALEQFGRIDILIHNAGIIINKPFAEMSPEDWFPVLDVHLNGAFYLLKSIYPLMAAQNYGRILLVTSSGGLFGIPGQAGYAAAKMGVVGLANAIKTEVNGKNIVCNVLSPLAATNQTAQALSPQLQPHLRPGLVAPMAAYLCSSECGESGSIYAAGGGYFSRLAIFEGKGIYLGEEEPDLDKLAEKMQEISDLSQARHVSSAMQAGRKILRRFMKSMYIEHT